MDQYGAWWNFSGVFSMCPKSFILPLKMHYIPPRQSWAIFDGILVECSMDWGHVL
jgi:hypothetical protein